MLKKCKIVILPTTNDSNIYLKPQNGHLLIITDIKAKKYATSLNFLKQHLYIISDDVIKEDDWCIDSNRNIFQHKNHFPISIGQRKLIAITDSSLGLPQPSKQFIQKYVKEYNKGNITTDILVEYENIYIDSFGTTIIQYEKDSDSYLKQCEFVTSRLKINPKDNTITIKKVKKIYTKEEVYQILEKYTSFIWKEVGIHYPVSLGIDAKDKFINCEL